MSLLYHTFVAFIYFIAKEHLTLGHRWTPRFIECQIFICWLYQIKNLLTLEGSNHTTLKKKSQSQDGLHWYNFPIKGTKCWFCCKFVLKSHIIWSAANSLISKFTVTKTPPTSNWRESIIPSKKALQEKNHNHVNKLLPSSQNSPSEP